MTTFQKQFTFVFLILSFLIVLVSQGFSKGKSKELLFTRDTVFSTTNIIVYYNDGDTVKLLTKIPRRIEIKSGKVYEASYNTNKNFIEYSLLDKAIVTYTKSKIKVVYNNSIGNIIIYTGSKPRKK